MILIGMDVATTSGLTCFNGERLVRCEAFKATGASNGAIFASFRLWLVSTLAAIKEQEGQVEAAAIEACLRSDMTRKVANKAGDGFEVQHIVPAATSERLHGLFAHAEEILATRNIATHIVHQATWRKAFTGNGRAKKEETLALVQRLFRERNIKSKDAAESLGVCWWLKGELNRRPEADLFQGAA